MRVTTTPITMANLKARDLRLRKKGDEMHAQAAVAEALRLNNRSVFAKRMQAGAAN